MYGNDKQQDNKVFFKCLTADRHVYWDRMDACMWRCNVIVSCLSNTWNVQPVR